MNLTPNFTIEEMKTTSTGLGNEIAMGATIKIFYLCQHILQPIRDEWGAIRVTSGYRNLYVNRQVGSKDTSQHLKGEAADIQTIDADIGVVFDWIVNESKIKFGQAILEKKNGVEWIHISLPRMGRRNQDVFAINDGVKMPYET